MKELTKPQNFTGEMQGLLASPLSPFSELDGILDAYGLSDYSFEISTKQGAELINNHQELGLIKYLIDSLPNPEDGVSLRLFEGLYLNIYNKAYAKNPIPLINKANFKSLLEIWYDKDKYNLSTKEAQWVAGILGKEERITTEYDGTELIISYPNPVADRLAKIQDRFDFLSADDGKMITLNFILHERESLFVDATKLGLYLTTLVNEAPVEFNLD